MCWAQLYSTLWDFQIIVAMAENCEWANCLLSCDWWWLVIYVVICVVNSEGKFRSGWRDWRTLLGTFWEEEARSRVGYRCTVLEGAQTYEENLHAETEERRRRRKQWEKRTDPGKWRLSRHRVAACHQLIIWIKTALLFTRRISLIS